MLLLQLGSSVLCLFKKATDPLNYCAIFGIPLRSGRYLDDCIQEATRRKVTGAGERTKHASVFSLTLRVQYTSTFGSIGFDIFNLYLQLSRSVLK